MLKKVFLGIAFVAIAAVLVVGGIQRTSANGSESYETGGRQGGGRWNGTGQAVASQPVGVSDLSSEMKSSGVDTEATTGTTLNSAITGRLSEEETAGLLWMREEEKLARDVYLALYDLWGQPTFKNIANSEQTHMNMVLDLLEGYGITDPAGVQGKFTNPDLQAFHDQMVEQGSRSVADALKVGAAIEEIDIADLRERTAQTDEAAIKTVYASLESGSENHLRAFTSTLTRRTGEVYQPQYLSANEYQTIVDATSGSLAARGNQANGNGRRGRR